MRIRHWLDLWRPAVYHGAGKQRNFFEGWYFKLVDAGEQHVYAVIPGIFHSRDGRASYSFVQTLDGNSGHTTWHSYAAADFRAAAGEFDVRVGPNHFRADAITLDIQAPDRQLHGTLRFRGVQPWPVKLLSPGVMGPFSFVPLMECYHGVVSLDHEIQGELQVDGQTITFDGGRGYTEKDWGAAFPRAWIWLQSNHFGQPGTSLTASVATIPWLGSAFRGFIVGLWHEGELYRFATYTGATIRSLSLDERQVTWQMAGHAGSGSHRGRYRLEITATRAEGGLIRAPFRTEMLQRVVESLTAAIEVRLVRETSAGDRVIFAGTGRHGGLEINGELGAISGARA